MLAGNENGQVRSEARSTEEVFLRRVGFIEKPNAEQWTGALDGIRFVLSECVHDGLIRDAIRFGLALDLLNLAYDCPEGILGTNYNPEDQGIAR